MIIYRPIILYKNEKPFVLKGFIITQIFDSNLVYG